MQNKDKFIQSLVRSCTHRALMYARHRQQGEELIGVALLTLSGVPDEVASGRMTDDNILGYLFCRIKTRCQEFKRRDHIIPVHHKQVMKGKYIMKPQSLSGLAIEQQQEVNVSELESIIKKSIITEGERLVIMYRRDGLTNKEIANALGCSESKVLRTINTVEKRFDDLVESLGFILTTPRRKIYAVTTKWSLDNE